MRGSIAELGERPYIVLMYMRVEGTESWKTCTGSIIDENFVLTVSLKEFLKLGKFLLNEGSFA